MEEDNGKTNYLCGCGDDASGGPGTRSARPHGSGTEAGSAGRNSIDSGNHRKPVSCGAISGRRNHTGEIRKLRRSIRGTETS